jgi:hypothetical protein
MVKPRLHTNNGLSKGGKRNIINETSGGPAESKNKIIGRLMYIMT